MSVLLIDIGNSRWKAAAADGLHLLELAVGDNDAADALAAFATRAADRVDAVWVASVAAPKITETLINRLPALGRGALTRVAATDRFPGVVNGYRRPEQIGVDRMLAMVAARAHCRGALCVIDAGTAITIDFVDAGGRHRGGFILPGRRLARECLLANTAIPRDAEADTEAVIGRDTPTAIDLGIRHAVAGLVERFAEGPTALFPGEAVSVVVGGGDAAAIASSLLRPCIRIDELVLQGLAVVAGSREG